MPWLSSLSQEVWTPEAVISELETADQKGYETPNFSEYAWLEIRNPVKIPADWLSEDLGLGELAAMALAMENNDRVLLLDDGLARKIARSAGLEVWGTLRILLEVKKSAWLRMFLVCSTSLFSLACGCQRKLRTVFFRLREKRRECPETN